jgi:membrane-associated phospholipid phosphatase
VGSSSLTAIVTGIGDSGVLLPVALVSAGMLWLFQSRRAAWLLLRSVLLAGFVIAALKVFFLSCGAHWQPGLISPSGHACLSAAVFGTLGTVAAAGRPVLARVGIAAIVALFVGIIAISRVVVGVHTWTEVILGLAVGVAAQLWFAWSYSRMEPPSIDLKTFGLVLSATLLLAFGIRIPAESFIRHMAKRVGWSCELADSGRELPVGANVSPIRR